MSAVRKKSLPTRLVGGIMRRALRKAFRRVEWIGDVPAFPSDRPVVLYANHHTFYDGYLAWLVLEEVLDREGLLWMNDWDRYPFFGAVGALPFPLDDARRRASTLRYTRRRLDADPALALILFPEGTMHPAEEGIRPFDGEGVRRLGRLLPGALWWPVAIHATWHADALPVARLGGGTPTDGTTGQEQQHLEAVWHAVRSSPPTSGRTLLAGTRGPDESWDLSFLRRFFEPN